MDSDLCHFGFDQDPYEVRISKIKHMLSETNSILDRMNYRNRVQLCGNHASPSYPSNIFSVPQYESFSNSFYDSYDCYVNADPYFRTDNLGWWEHPNFNYRGKPENVYQFQHESPTTPEYEDGLQSLKEIMQKIAATT